VKLIYIKKWWYTSYQHLLSSVMEVELLRISEYLYVTFVSVATDSTIYIR